MEQLQTEVKICISHYFLKLIRRVQNVNFQNLLLKSRIIFQKLSQASGNLIFHANRKIAQIHWLP